MSVKTDLAETILQSEEAKQIYDSISPIYGYSYTALWLMQVIGIQLDDFKTWTDQYLYQVTPATATWTIDYWEKEYGIIPNHNWTLKQRQGNLINKMLYRAPMPPYKLEQIAGNITQVPVVIDENVAKNTFHVLLRGFADDLKVEEMKKAIMDAKPAHLIFDVRIALLFEPEIKLFTGTKANQYTLYHVEVVD